MAKMPTSVIMRWLLLDWDRIQGILSAQICRLIEILNTCGITNESAWDLFYEIVFPDPVTPRHYPQSQLMWLDWRSRCSPFREWWAAFISYTWATVWHNPPPNQQLEVWQPPCLQGSSWLLHSAEEKVTEGLMHRQAIVLVCWQWSEGKDWAAKLPAVQARWQVGL